MPKRILVTGGAGFIGSHLCRKLLETGADVIAVDNLCTGREGNLADLKENPRFTFIKADILDPIELPGPLHRIYNLACPASPVGYQRLPLETLYVGSVGVSNILELALKNKARFLQTSTSEIYGDPLEHPQKETYWGNVNCVGPRACYDESKRFAESLIINFAKVHGLNAKIVRLFNTYGPQMDLDDGRVIVNFLKQALSGESLTVHGDGSQTRSPCYVSDLVSGLILMMESGEAGPVNLGNPEELTIIDLAKMIKKITGSKSEIIFLPLPKDDPTRRRPDITLAKQRLGWSPRIGLEEGLRLTIPYIVGKLKS
ncbi:MAG: UDP-glucuronic acid decarboxylase family protein [Patescibacteria group bacterium]